MLQTFDKVVISHMKKKKTEHEAIREKHGRTAEVSCVLSIM